MSEAQRSPNVTERRVPRWMWVALILSLGLNLLVVGVVASAAWHFRSHGPDFQGRLSAYLDTLPPERTSTLKRIVERHQPELRPLRQEIRQMRRDAAELFAADPLDKEALANTHARLMDAEVRIRQGYAQFMTELAEKMTAEERRGFIEWRERHRPWSRRANVASGQQAR